MPTDETHVIHLKSACVYTYINVAAVYGTLIVLVVFNERSVSSTSVTVKRYIFVCPLFYEFRYLTKFSKITGCKYSNGNLCTHY